MQLKRNLNECFFLTILCHRVSVMDSAPYSLVHTKVLEPWNSFRYALFGESYDMVMRLFLNEHYEGYIYAMECT